jgi:hypothetical protein
VRTSDRCESASIQDVSAARFDAVMAPEAVSAQMVTSDRLSGLIRVRIRGFGAKRPRSGSGVRLSGSSLITMPVGWPTGPRCLLTLVLRNDPFDGPEM